MSVPQSLTVPCLFYHIYSEPLLMQEDATEVEIPLIHGAEEKEEEEEGAKKEGGGGGEATYKIDCDRGCCWAYVERIHKSSGDFP